MSYNGYVNYETWNVALWLNNEPGSHFYWTEQAQYHLDDQKGDKENAAADMAIELESQLSSHNLPNGLYSDLLTHALGMVDWQEVAESFTDDLEYESED